MSSAAARAGATSPSSGPHDCSVCTTEPAAGAGTPAAHGQTLMFHHSHGIVMAAGSHLGGGRFGVSKSLHDVFKEGCSTSSRPVEQRSIEPCHQPHHVGTESNTDDSTAEGRNTHQPQCQMSWGGLRKISRKTPVLCCMQTTVNSHAGRRCSLVRSCLKYQERRRVCRKDRGDGGLPS